MTVAPVSTKEAVYITKGKSEVIRFLKVVNKNATAWASSDEEKATVIKSGKNSGKVTGVSCGSSEISCSFNGFVYARKKGRSVISTKINGTTYKLTIEVKE